jgi:hypothetical protein
VNSTDNISGNGYTVPGVAEIAELLSTKDREYPGIAVKPVMKDFAVGEKSDQWDVAEVLSS